jgi:hypothetical protein
MYNGTIIMSDPTKMNKERRRKIYISMLMDKMEDCTNILPTRDRAHFNIT